VTKKDTTLREQTTKDTKDHKGHRGTRRR